MYNNSNNKQNIMKKEDCNLNEMQKIINYILVELNNTKLNEYKNLILEYFIKNKIVGKKFKSMQKIEFTKSIAKYVNNIKLREPSNKLYFAIITFDLNKIKISQHVKQNNDVKCYNYISKYFYVKYFIYIKYNNIGQ